MLRANMAIEPAPGHIETHDRLEGSAITMRPTRPTQQTCGGLGRFLGVMLLVSTVACARTPANPFDGSLASPSGADVTYYTVRFEVSCDTCMISWNARNQNGRGQEKGLWSYSTSVGLRGSETTSAQLSASPVAGPVTRLRIFVNGDVVAEVGRGTQDAGAETLTAQAIIPPPSRREAEVTPQGWEPSAASPP